MYVRDGRNVVLLHPTLLNESPADAIPGVCRLWRASPGGDDRRPLDSSLLVIASLTLSPVGAKGQEVRLDTLQPGQRVNRIAERGGAGR